jgi:hypothetical protein
MFIRRKSALHKKQQTIFLSTNIDCIFMEEKVKYKIRYETPGFELLSCCEIQSKNLLSLFKLA